MWFLNVVDSILTLTVNDELQWMPVAQRVQFEDLFIDLQRRPGARAPEYLLYLWYFIDVWIVCILSQSQYNVQLDILAVKAVNNCVKTTRLVPYKKTKA